MLPDGSPARVIVGSGGNLTVEVGARRVLPPRPLARVGGVGWYVPYTRVHPLTVAGVPVDAVWADVTGSPIAYFALLLAVWSLGESFALLEHDVVCRPDVIAAFEECPEPWCTYGYSDICHPGCMDAWANALGCTRFSGEAVRAVPDAVSAIPADNWDWHNVCDGLGANLRAAGLKHHWHYPWVEHHHMGRHDS